MPTPSSTLSGLPAEMLDHIMDNCDMESKANLRLVSKRFRAQVDNRTKRLQKYINEHIPDNTLFCVVFFHELEKVRKRLGQSYQPDLCQRFIEKFEQFVPSNIEELMTGPPGWGTLALHQVIMDLLADKFDLFPEDEEDIPPCTWEAPGPCTPFTLLSPEQVKTLRAMLPTDALELEAIKARLDNINELIDERGWEVKEGFGENEFPNRCQVFVGIGRYITVDRLTGVVIRYMLGQLAQHACQSPNGPFSPEERGLFQMAIYRALICNWSRLGHAKIKTRREYCDGQAVICWLSHTGSGSTFSRFAGQEDITGALEFDHILEESRVMRYVDVLFTPFDSYLCTLFGYYLAISVPS